MIDRLIELIINAPKLDCIKGGRANGKTYQTVQNIADYLVANGVILPPCKVGDIVYLFYPVRKGIYEAVVEEICLTKKSNFIITRDLYFNRRQSIFFEQLGKTVFLTKEEAEKALRGGGE